ncbi:hypothetical protein EHH44_20020 [Mycolicibacter terrae]|uniref:Uncharacterized protein n=1 Tax=Mycolicibacter terrae TaxID=1788 RepID=A0ACD2EI49_9MYCO|nr:MULTISPECIES: hypothetical protein [Mycolicibacter]OBH15024.1 hypothetical protein A5694_10685 [Mycolicibacter sinensis]RRR40698.1 hypothetical protein EHH44_20020 [Mycolicibacter terrae]
MLIIALVLAAIGLAALVFAVVTSNALVAWVCIGASLLGVLLLIVDALRERRRNSPAAAPEAVSDAAEAPADPEAFTDADADDDAEDGTPEVAETVDSDALEDYDGVAVEDNTDDPVTHPAD